ncbi:Coq3p [Malassezia vespertilionis]|uniref:Coq3p n=1 Tax=Malassezia vespertilionis TaxID=2020962 RepID=A0A2N1J875_9BASI|nr:Coq3p [Malassezia vespertilionis]
MARCFAPQWRSAQRAFCTGTSERLSSYSSVDPVDIAHFARLAEHWWDEDGEFKPLHRMNRVRVQFMREKLDEVYGWDAAMADVLGKPIAARAAPAEFLRGTRLLDIGSGGGILTEANIRTALLHAEQDPSLHVRTDPHTSQAHSLAYVHGTAESLLASGKQYDIVTAMEVVEHVHEPAEFLRCIGSLLRPGGHLFLSTMSRTALSYVLTIFLAENVLRAVTPGTHRHAQYINPHEMVEFFKTMGWIRTGDPDAVPRARLSNGAPVAPVPPRLQFETRGTMYLPVLDRWVLAPQRVADAQATAQNTPRWIPSALGGAQRITEQCNYFFWVRKPLDA